MTRKPEGGVAKRHNGRVLVDPVCVAFLQDPTVHIQSPILLPFRLLRFLLYKLLSLSLSLSLAFFLSFNQSSIASHCLPLHCQKVQFSFSTSISFDFFFICCFVFCSFISVLLCILMILFCLMFERMK